MVESAGEVGSEGSDCDIITITIIIIMLTKACSVILSGCNMCERLIKDQADGCRRLCMSRS